jgi:outer membrane protein W
MWIRSAAISAIAIIATATSAYAQRVEASIILGWTFSDGVTGDAVLAGDGNLYDAIDVKDSVSWGFGVGFNATENVEVGFLFGQQLSTLAVEGTATQELGDLKVNTYHPYFAYNFGEADAQVRPYVLFGLGATNYGKVSYATPGGRVGETGSETQFSTTIGAGVKAFPSPKVGFRVGVQWTPTYIKSDAAGWWCDPYWGCYLASSAQYSNQFQFNGGVTFRF